MQRIAFLESNLSGSGFQALRVARDMGLHVTFLTRDLERYLAVPGAASEFESCVDEYRFCETNEEESVWEAIAQEAETGAFAAFLTLGEYDVPVAAAIARRLGLPGLNPDAGWLSRNKYLTRLACEKRGVPAPRFRLVRSAKEALEAVALVGLPCVVKPADETSSTDVVLCMTAEEASDCVGMILEKKANTRGQTRFPGVLVEECLIGYEVSVETISYGGVTTVLGVTDKMTAAGGRFVEIGHTFPSSLPASAVSACARTAQLALEAIGFDFGAAHVELKVTQDGPKLVEINARPAGGRIPDLVELVTGVSAVRETVRLALGEPPQLSGSGQVGGAAIRFLTGMIPGVIFKSSGVELLPLAPGVREVMVPDDLVGRRVGRLTRNGDRLGYVITTAGTAFEAGRCAEAALQLVKLETAEPQEQTALAASMSGLVSVHTV
jgi:biotin carboxylase